MVDRNGFYRLLKIQGMKQSLQLRLGQQLTMTPQLQQAIRLLQLSSLDLQTEIQQAVENNPLLEMDETSSAPEQPADESPASGENPDSEYLQYLEHTAAEPWKTSQGQSYTMADRPTDYPDSHKTLKDHLASQLDYRSLNETDQFIASSLIDAIDEDGYLTITPIELLESCDASMEITLEEITAVLNMIQHLDPVGVGARDLRECLQLQLTQIKPAHTDSIKLALEIITNQFDALGQKDYSAISKQTGLDIDEVRQAIDIIQQLNPRPGNVIDAIPTEYITPDVYVRKIKGQWQVILNEGTAPRVKLNDYYASFIRRADDSRDNLFLKNNLQEARWFLKSLDNRNDTLLKVANMIVSQQKEFLEYGEESMKPLILRDIAEAIEMHESTISRVTTQKYMHTPRGIFEFKYFFSSHVSTANGGECSSTAIRAMIKKLVTSEDNRKPFSDNKLAQLLEQKGVKVARRTVAKYRESLLIPPSNERRMRA